MLPPLQVHNLLRHLLKEWLQVHNLLRHMLKEWQGIDAFHQRWAGGRASKRTLVVMSSMPRVCVRLMWLVLVDFFSHTVCDYEVLQAE